MTAAPSLNLDYANATAYVIDSTKEAQGDLQGSNVSQLV